MTVLIKIKKSIVLWLAFLASCNTVLFSQVNLVPNPSFEDTISCPFHSGQLYNAAAWHTPLQGGGGNPELFNICSYQYSVPFQPSINSFQNTFTGVGYAGLDATSPLGENWREYIQSKLIKRLSSNHTYCVKFYVSLSDNCYGYIKTLGAYFDNGSVAPTPQNGIAYVVPQVVNTSQSLSDTINWMKIENSFIATGTEEYITIGNFFTDSTSGLGILGSPTYWYSYYYIDDVSVIPSDLPVYAGNDVLIYSGDSVFIGRQPEIGLDEDCIWFVNGVPIDTVAGLWVQPDSTTTYIVQQTICGNVKWDTVRVSVDGTGVDDITHGLTRGFEVYPNPSNGSFTLYLKGNNPLSEKAEVIIYNAIGNKLGQFDLKLDRNTAVFNTGLDNGIYFITVNDSNGNSYQTKRIIIIK